MDPLTVFYISMVNGFKILIYLQENIYSLLLVIILLQFVSISLTHTNLKTWIAKAIWGVKRCARLLDRHILRLVDNRDI